MIATIEWSSSTLPLYCGVPNRPTNGAVEPIVARLDEHGKDVVTDVKLKVHPTRKYHWKIERVGKRITWWVDDMQTPFLTLDDPNPLEGPGHEYFGFNNWETDTWFDYDVALTPIAGALYRNQGSVTWTNAGNGGVGDPGTTQTWETLWVPFTLPDPTVTETDDAAALADLLTCPAGFTCTPSSGSWSLTGTRVIEYSVAVTNVSAPCAHTAWARNTATLTENDSGQQDADSAAVTITTPDCTPPPSFQGCTPGYWKQPHHFGNWVGYVPTGPGARST